MSVGSEESLRSMGLLRETSSRVDQGSRDIETESIRNQIEDVDSGTASIAGSLTEVSQGITEINNSVKKSMKWPKA